MSNASPVFCYILMLLLFDKSIALKSAFRRLMDWFFLGSLRRDHTIRALRHFCGLKYVPKAAMSTTNRCLCGLSLEYYLTGQCPNPVNLQNGGQLVSRPGVSSLCFQSRSKSVHKSPLVGLPLTSNASKIRIRLSDVSVLCHVYTYAAQHRDTLYVRWQIFFISRKATQNLYSTLTVSLVFHGQEYFQIDYVGKHI